VTGDPQVQQLVTEFRCRTGHSPVYHAGE
jgi:hypothetical protein